MAKKNRRLNEPPEPGAQIYIVIAPDGGYGWVVVAASFWCVFLVDGVIYSYANFEEVLQKDLGVSLTEIMVIPSVAMGVYQMFGPLFSALVNRFGFRLVAFSGGVIASIGYLSASFFTSYVAHLILYGLIAGMGSGMVYSPAIIIIGYYFEKYRALATGIAVCGSGVGVLVTSIGLGASMDEFGWKFTFRVQALIVMLSSLVALLLSEVKPTLVEVNLEDDYENEPVPIDRATIGSPSMAMSNKEYNSKFQNSMVFESNEKRRTFPCCCKKTKATNEKALRTGILAKHNIFYGGSLENIKEQNVSPKQEMPLRTIFHNPVKHTHCLAATKRVLGMLLDWSLLRSPSFICILLALFFQGLGLLFPYLFLRGRAEHNHLPKSISDSLVTYLSVGNIVGRVSGGLCSFFPKVRDELVLSQSCIVGGIVILVSAFYGEKSADLQIVYSVLIGFTMAFVQTLRTIVIVKFMGLDKLTNAFGLTTLVMGCATLVGNPIAAKMKEATKSYTLPFVYFAILNLVAGSLWIALPLVNRWENRKSVKK